MREKFMRWLSETFQSFIGLEVYFAMWPLLKGIWLGFVKTQGEGSFNEALAIMNDVYRSITEGVAFSDRILLMILVCIMSGKVNSKLRGIPGWFKSRRKSKKAD